MPTTVSLSQMVDLSLGTPEIGSVNFNVMHSLLHAIIRNLRIADVKADIDERDRDFLATSKIRVGSTLSDADSGRGEESEDGISEKSAPPFRPTPYHRMEIKVEKLAQQLEQLNQLPSTNDLFARTTKSKETSENPVADLWQYMQMKKRVDANEEGVGKLFSLVEDMMKQMKELKDENKALQDKLKALDLGDLYKRLDELENITAELSDQFANLPTAEEFTTFVTWPDLEAALKGLRTEFEPVEPEPVEMQTVESQTEVSKENPVEEEAESEETLELKGVPSVALKAASSVAMQRAASLESRPSTPTVAIKAASSIAMQRAASIESRESTPSVEIKTASSVGLVETESIGLRGTPSVAVRAASSVDLGQAESVELGGTPNVAVKGASSVELKKAESEEKDTPAFAIKAASSAGLKTEKSEEDVKEEPESLELKPVELSASKSEEIRHIPLSGARSEAFKPISPERKPIMHRSRSGMMLSPLGKRQSRSLSPSPSRSRPGSSRLSRVSSTSIGPSGPLLDILERLGKLDEDHGLLKVRVEDLEAALKGLDLSADFLEQLGKLKAEIDALAASKDKSSPGDVLAFLASVIAMLSRIRKMRLSDDSTSTDTETAVESSTSEEMLNQGVMAVFQDSDPACNSELLSRIAALEERFKSFQEVLIDDSAYAGSSDVTDLTSWLGQMETKIAGHNLDPSATEESDVGSEQPESQKSEKKEEKKEPVKKKEEEVEERLDEEKGIIQTIEELLAEPTEISSQMLLSAPELQATNERLKALAHNLNDQLHGLRDKVFLLDHELKRMAKGVEFALMRAKFAGVNEMDSDALSRAQHAILQLQSEVEKLHTTTTDIIDENRIRTKEIQDLLAYCDRLQREKADKEYVMMEVEVKADKRALENKVNHKLFDQTTDEINKMIKEILDKLADHEADWKSAYGKLSEDLDGKLDRLELDPLKEWLEARLKALNDKLKKYQNNMDWSEDDAAGIRKQLIQRFHCISCDRPVDMMPTGPQPSLPAQSGLPPTRSPRPYTTFELEQIRQHAKRPTKSHSAPANLNRSCLSGRNAMNYERALAMKQLASLKKSDLRAYLIHFKQDFEAATREASFAGGTGGTGGGTGTETTDYYATPRPCGGSHTLTYPHKRNTKLTHLSHLFREEEGIVIPIPKEEVDVQGVDGHIYRGRSDLMAPRPPKLEARLPPQLGANNNNLNVNQRPMSPQPPQTRRATTAGKSPLITQQQTRPTSARTPITPRPSSAGPNQTPQGSRPTSARVVQSMDESRLDNGEPDPVPQEAFMDQGHQAPDGMDEDGQQTETIQMPSAEETGQ